MKYINTDRNEPGGPDRVGVLITNLGTPDAPEKKSLRRYLKQFLSDPRVVEIPRLLWWFILNLVILNIRPSRSAAAYKTVWTERGSPLMFHTRDQAEHLRQALGERFGDQVIVDFAMRYGSPSFADVIDRMMAEGVTRLLVLPLYPQYSCATTGSTFDAVAEEFTRRRSVPSLRFVSRYYDHADYIGAMALSIRAFQREHGTADKLVFSYHGTPQRYCDQGDPYYCECIHTSQLIAELLDLPEDSYMTTFQSRFGREAWLQPYTDETLKSLPGKGVKSVQIVCPGFSADCLETIEEIGEENREYFMEAGGESYQYIPCLNSEPEHIAVLAQIAEEELQGWVLKRLE
ncbi:ferrochelatase [Pseudohalioglobus sediminis]|uniref:Ferrochelatase n=1 Tax=Pseudohalioglobus sediminis TaxID=2606449 RepID=A0A5B0WNA8_9GAMM|nr:ferrochelatase [Pseudohalioglobus sediminis]KAA1188463.1 ferrochelatase [Pseudohalioglobus sediminis]